MDIFCFLKTTNEVDPIEAALVADSPEEMQRSSMALESAFNEIKKWTTEAAHGAIVSSFGRELCIKIPMELLEELDIKINKFDPIKISAGIGHTPKEAFEALKMAIDKDSKMVLFKAEGDAPAQLSQPTQPQAPTGAPQEANPKKSTKQKIIETLLMVKQHSQDILKLKEINPKAYDAIKKIIDAMLSMAKDPSFQKTEEKVEQEMSEPAETSKELQKNGIIPPKPNPFADIQAKMAQTRTRIQELASTTKGSAWAHPNGSAIVSLDPHDPRRQNWRVSLLDHEGQPVGHSVHPSHEAALRTLSDHSINVMDKPHQTMSKAEDAMEMTLGKKDVIGTIKNGRMKVQERDEATRAVKGTHWHRLLDGMAMGPNGHAVSPDKAGKKE